MTTDINKAVKDLKAGADAMLKCKQPFEALAVYEGLSECVLNLFHLKWDKIYEATNKPETTEKVR